MALPGHGSIILVGDPRSAVVVEDTGILVALVSTRRLPGSNHHQELLFVISLIQYLPLGRPLRQLLYSRLRFRVLCAQMSLLDESARQHRNSRHAGVH